MTEHSSPKTTWHPWIVALGSGFEVQDVAQERAGTVGLLQIDKKQFDVTRRFRFSAPDVEKALLDRLVRNGMTAAEARTAVDEADVHTQAGEPHRPGLDPSVHALVRQLVRPPHAGRRDP